jgi:hypothetical protein
VKAAAMPISNLQTFDLPKLPAELQLMVWKLAMSGPRLIEVEWKDPDKLKLENRVSKQTSKIISLSSCSASYLP